MMLWRQVCGRASHLHGEIGMGKQWRERVLSRLESTFAWFGYAFVSRWGRFERGITCAATAPR